MDNKDYFIHEKETIELDVVKLEKQGLKITFLRAGLFLVMLFVLLAGYFFEKQWLYLVSLVMLGLFIYIVVVGAKLTERLQYLRVKQQVFERYLARFDGTWKQFANIGVSESKGMNKDLDILGKDSLFQYLNCTVTSRGKKLLVDRLTKPKFDLQEIKLWQEGIKELSEDLNNVIELETLLLLLQKPQLFLEMVSCQKTSKLEKFLAKVLPAITILLLALVVFSFKGVLVLLAFFIFLQWGIALTKAYRQHDFFNKIRDMSKEITKYQKITNTVMSMSFSSQLLTTIQSELSLANEALTELNKIANRIKQRNNLVALILLNGLLMWDTNCKMGYNKWYEEYYSELSKWLDNVAKIETCLSLQVVYQTHLQTTLPQFNSEMVLSIEQMKHPLIATTKAVANDFNLKQHCCIITGSNMSGKTTFLRTLGINLVLAYAGGPVIARKFSCPLCHLYTSMRIEDDISGISTFYGELLRIKEMIKARTRGEKMIVLIDEIFKGTNSRDRIIGAQETIKCLTSVDSFVFVTTHDFELCDLEAGMPCVNYHFDEYYVGNEIKFDYLIKKGRSQTTNGQYLLRMVGIIK